MIDEFLVVNGHQFYEYSMNNIEDLYGHFKIKDGGKKVVWKHKIYQEIGCIRERSSLWNVIKKVINCFKEANPVFALKSLFKSVFFSNSFHTIYRRSQRSLLEIAEEYRELKQKKLFPELLIPQPFIREGLTISMKGLAVLAAYLSQKSNLSNLNVCERLFDLRSHLKKIAETPDNSRHAFIVPCHQSVVNQDPRAVVEQHMLSVLVEKRDKKMYVCVLEPMVMEAMNLDVVMKLNIDSVKPQSILFSPEEQVMAFVKSACPEETTNVYYSAVRRQYGPNGGCSTFALRDSVNFLRSPLFFQEIQVKESQGRFHAIGGLPPIFMQPMQSLKKIKEYIDLNPKSAKQKLGKRGLSLQEAVNRRSYQELRFSSDGGGRVLNKYIDERTAKYQELLIRTLKQIPCTS